SPPRCSRPRPHRHTFPTRRSSDLPAVKVTASPTAHSPPMSSHSEGSTKAIFYALGANGGIAVAKFGAALFTGSNAMMAEAIHSRSEEHTSELQSRFDLVCRLLLEK